MTIKQKIFDIFIMGGGINGVGIAADAASRGLSVCLIEKNDLANGTSSASSKLIHGGLRYLENYQFGLVRQSLKERQLLLEKAPHLVHPLEFIMPYHPRMRPLWLMRMGLFLYNHLAKSKSLSHSKIVQFQDEKNPIAQTYQKGLSYMDCWVDDARLVVLTARLAQNHSAEILTRHTITAIETLSEAWQITLKNNETHAEQKILATVLVNATGPWFNHVSHQFQLPTQNQIQLVKGSHIVIHKLYEGNHAYTLQHHDGRIIFTIPFQKQFTLIGTTDVYFEGDPQNVAIECDEISYLCQVINSYFKRQISPAEIIWQFSGVRALIAKKNVALKTLSREYQIELTAKNKLPLLNILGGKITTHRHLAEEAVDLIRPLFQKCGVCLTKQLFLPGGNLGFPTFNLFLQQIKEQYSFLPTDLLIRYAYSYGSLIHELLSSVHTISDLGLGFNHGLYQREIEYLKQYEWAQKSEDFLWRRTKLGLFFSNEEKNNLENFLKND